MGLGIWSMHYTGMLAFHRTIPIYYHLPTVALSLLAAIAASGVALFVASRDHLGWQRVALGSPIMGAGIAGMHFIGMAAMRMPATIDWHPLVVVLSITIAVAVAGVALWFAFRYGRPTASAWSWRKVGTALLMGAAIPAMHYTGMAAAQFRAAPPHDLGRAVDISVLGAYAIAAGTMLVLAMAIGTSLVSRYGEERLRSSEARYRTLATELQKALTEVRTLQGILPICASCKRIHTDQNTWQPVESYVRDHTEAEFSHGLCPDCAARDWGTAAS